MMSNSYQIVQVPFRGDIIDAVQTADGEVFVNPITICDSLGIRWENQRVKLLACAWATTLIMGVVAKDGRRRDVTMIPLKVVPMWLSHISVNKVRPNIRAKLLEYQLEVVEVLSAWFLGISDVPGLAAEMNGVKDRLAEVEGRLESTRLYLIEARRQFNALLGREVCTEFMTLRKFVDTYEIRGLHGAAIKGSRLRVISRQLNKLSQVMGAEVRKEFHPAFDKVNSYRFDILQAWYAVTHISNVANPEDFEKLVTGRIFI